ncbi:MAG: hypothetical protein HQL91_10440 [Magnetococcales bacterium]|nr:hypothetical protein [Magnetococcales bacterium]
MEITWHPDSSDWQLVGGPLARLQAAMSEPTRGVVLFSDNPEQELEELIAALFFLRFSGAGERLIVAATSHPSAAWVQRMRASGADHRWAVVCHGTEKTIIPIEQDPCPLLHTKQDNALSLSVCGANQDRLALSSAQFRRWCLNNASGCPHFLAFQAAHSPLCVNADA